MMPAGVFRRLLAVLDGSRNAAMLEVTAALAERDHGQVTLVARCGDHWRSFWSCGVPIVPEPLPPDPDLLRARAHDEVARAAEFMPQTVSVTTIVLDGRPRRLAQLAAGGAHDLLVVGAQLGRRRWVRRLPIATLVVPEPDEREPVTVARSRRRPRVHR